jgi:acyl carrier protein
MSLEIILAEVLVVPEAAIFESLALKDIPSWDSLTHMMLIVRLEEHYMIQFSGDEIADIQSVGDIRKMLRTHGVEI